MNSIVDPFSHTAIQNLSKKLGDFFRTDLKISEAETNRFINEARDGLIREKDGFFSEIYDLLDRSKIRERWIERASGSRSTYLADWVYPHTKGSVLDLLCGHGEVGSILHQYGLETTLTERVDTYDYNRDDYKIPFLPFDELENLNSLPKFDTTLISVVLHHEVDPIKIMDLASSITRKRIIVIENCLEDDFSESDHQLIDLFFNSCLSKNNLPSPGSHQTIEDWTHLCSQYGKVVKIEHKDSVPGIPLRHHLIVIEKQD